MHRRVEFSLNFGENVDNGMVYEWFCLYKMPQGSAIHFQKNPHEESSWHFACILIWIAIWQWLSLSGKYLQLFNVPWVLQSFERLVSHCMYIWSLYSRNNNKRCSEYFFIYAPSAFSLSHVCFHYEYVRLRGVLKFPT